MYRKAQRQGAATVSFFCLLKMIDWYFIQPIYGKQRKIEGGSFDTDIIGEPAPNNDIELVTRRKLWDDYKSCCFYDIGERGCRENTMKNE